MASPRQSAPKPKRKAPPHAFIIEALASMDPEIRPMFSGFAVYLGNLLIFMLRDSDKSPRDNGLWLVLSESVDPANASHKKMLKKEFPSLRKIDLLGGVISHWLLIPSDSPTFEEESLHACDLVLNHDPRIGRIPKSRR